jgi:hypothetical protein
MTDSQGRLQAVPHAELGQRVQQGWQVGPPSQQKYEAAPPKPSPTIGQRIQGIIKNAPGSDATPVEPVIRELATGLAKMTISISSTEKHVS